MARRKSNRKKTSRSRSSGVNVVNLAQTYLQTSIITQAAFRANPIQFLTGSTTQTTTQKVGTNYGVSYDVTTTGYQPIADGTVLTLPELMGFDAPDGTSVPFGGVDAMNAIRANIKANGGYAKPLIQTLLLNGGFSVGRKLFSRQRSLMNKAAKMSGLNKMVKF